MNFELRDPDSLKVGSKPSCSYFYYKGLLSCYLFILPSLNAQFRLWADSAQGKVAGGIHTITSTKTITKGEKAQYSLESPTEEQKHLRKLILLVTGQNWVGYKPILSQLLSPH